MKKNIYRTVIYVLYSLSYSTYTSEEQSDVLRRILDTVQHTGYSNVAPIPPFYTQSYTDAKKQLKEAEKTRERAIERGIKKMHIEQRVGKELEPEVKDLSLLQWGMYQAGVALGGKPLTSETEPIIEERNEKIKKYKKEARQKIEAELTQQEKRERQEAQARIARNIGSGIRKTENYLTNSEMLRNLAFKIGSALRTGRTYLNPLSTPEQLHTKQEIENLADELYQKSYQKKLGERRAGIWPFPSSITKKERDILHNEAMKEAKILLQFMPPKNADYTVGSSLRRAWNSAKGYFSPVNERTKAADVQKQKHLEQKRLEAADAAMAALKQRAMLKPGNVLSPEEEKNALMGINIMWELSPKNPLERALSQPKKGLFAKKEASAPKGLQPPPSPPGLKYPLPTPKFTHPDSSFSKPDEAVPSIPPKKSFWQRFSSPPAGSSKEASNPYQDVLFLD